MTPTQITIECFLHHHDWDEPQVVSDVELGEGAWTARAKLGSPRVVRGLGASPAQALAALRAAMERELSFPLGDTGPAIEVTLKVVKMRWPQERGGVIPGDS